MSTPDPLRIHGTLEPVGSLKGHGLMNPCRSPDGRYVGLRRGLSVVVVDTLPDTPTLGVVHKSVVSQETSEVLHPDGQRLVVRERRRHLLRVYGPEGLRAEVHTDTVRLSWDGQRLPPDAPRPTWGWADEHLMVSADGRHVVLATHDADGQACVLLFEIEGLALVDTLTDLRLYSFYAVYDAPGKPDFVPMHTWSESWLEPDLLDPAVMLGVRNAGDCCLGVFRLEVRDGRLVNVDPEAFSQAVLSVDNYFLRGLRRLPGDGLLVLDRDHGLTRLSWPPTREKVASVWSTRHLRQDGYDLKLPFPTPGPDDLWEADDLTITDRHVLLNLQTGGGLTVAMVAFDLLTLQPIGLVKRPASRTRFGELEHLGRDLFAGVGRTSTKLWRLRVSPSDGG
ncbi:MAG: hypothetical protein H6739_24490 [Alphaproteobacteria bacterium]|nr:hypothetical protein [Alphaproteobacteria bacterium]